jgi:hypothetical protein
MHLERPAGPANMIDVLDRVLDKGIVVDAWMLMSVAGISLVTLEARIVVASIETYMKHASVIGQLGPLAAPPPVQPAGRGKSGSTLCPDPESRHRL